MQRKTSDTSSGRPRTGQDARPGPGSVRPACRAWLARTPDGPYGRASRLHVFYVIVGWDDPNDDETSYDPADDDDDDEEGLNAVSETEVPVSAWFQEMGCYQSDPETQSEPLWSQPLLFTSFLTLQRSSLLALPHVFYPQRRPTSSTWLFCTRRDTSFSGLCSTACPVWPPEVLVHPRHFGPPQVFHRACLSTGRTHPPRRQVAAPRTSACHEHQGELLRLPQGRAIDGQGDGNGPLAERAPPGGQTFPPRRGGATESRPSWTSSRGRRRSLPAAARGRKRAIDCGSPVPTGQEAECGQGLSDEKLVQNSPRGSYGSQAHRLGARQSADRHLARRCSSR